MPRVFLALLERILFPEVRTPQSGVSSYATRGGRSAELREKRFFFSPVPSLLFPLLASALPLPLLLSGRNLSSYRGD